jgi:hypothetical protein
MNSVKEAMADESDNESDDVVGSQTQPAMMAKGAQPMMPKAVPQKKSAMSS